MEEKSVIIFYSLIIFSHTEKRVNKANGTEQRRKKGTLQKNARPEIITLVITKTNEVNF